MPPEKPNSNAVAFILQTSGTTALSKLIPFSHGNMLAAAAPWSRCAPSPSAISRPARCSTTTAGENIQQSSDLTLRAEQYHKFRGETWLRILLAASQTGGRARLAAASALA